MLENKVYGRYASFFKNHELKEADEYIKRVFPNAEFYIDYEHALVFERIGEDEEIDLDYHTVINEIAYNAARVNPGKEGCMNSALYKQAGNSIPVPIFESIFRKIILNQTDSSSKENRLF